MRTHPVWLIAGGSSAGEFLIQDFRHFFLNCANTNPIIAYIGTANGESKIFFDRMRSHLLEAGAKDVLLVPILGNCDIDSAKRILWASDAIFLSGGEVEDGMRGLKTIGLDTFLVDLYQDGKKFLGLSAGCIMMGQHWVHWDTEGDDSTASLFDCLGLVPLTLDAHGEDEDWKELKCALHLLGSGSSGYGLSNGGFYCADETGTLKNARAKPVMFGNHKGQAQLCKK